MHLIQDTMDYYFLLHPQHLLGLATTSDAPWEYTQVEIDHHAEEMEVIWNMCDSWLQCLCTLYCYLRYGQTNNWHSNSLQYKRNMELFSCMLDGGSVASNVDESSTDGYYIYICEKCKTCLHTGGCLNCPWGHLGDDRAKKEAARALRCLATGRCNPNTNARKPIIKAKSKASAKV
jgi:hypothetical protein